MDCCEYVNENSTTSDEENELHIILVLGAKFQTWEVLEGCGLGYGLEYRLGCRLGVWIRVWIRFYNTDYDDHKESFRVDDYENYKLYSNS
ncbi:uncharacterized protein OCT59_022212 [Rhizophagus irregularis]|uniref:uncharacterized protein n=1 Tax=Rhizophagus irregularis TaxID=588596 RepID=UPI0033181A9F|nr:hypothetical protein OCT59_022212 [Rhizophagus irregularis]